MQIFFTNFSLKPFFLLDNSQLSDQQKKIIKISLVIFASLLAIFYCFVIDALRQRVTVNEDDMSTYTTHIKNIEGFAKVHFNGFFASGSRAEGFFKKGKMDGPGWITFPLGLVQKEEGIFKDGWLVDGETIFRDGTKEIGHFKNGLLDGQGIRIFSNQEVEKGLFENGELIGASV